MGGMRGAAINGRTILTRIVALLLALAGIAERAGGVTMPVHLLVLFMLNRAETAARIYACSVGAVSTTRAQAEVCDRL